jgi:hypothetical protein
MPFTFELELVHDHDHVRMGLGSMSEHLERTDRWLSKPTSLVTPLLLLSILDLKFVLDRCRSMPDLQPIIKTQRGDRFSRGCHGWL